MYSSSTFWLTALAMLTLGAVAGYLASRWLVPAEQQRRELEAALDEMKQRQRDYQKDVGQHFSRSAELLNSLASDYREIYNHLAQGAQALCDPADAPRLTRLPEPGGDEPPAAAPLEPPRDYAPRRSPGEKGALHEAFGLDKPAPEREPEPPKPI